MKKQIIVAPILEFGGSNSHLKLLIEYFGKENSLIILDNKEQFKNVRKVDSEGKIAVKVISDLKSYVTFNRKTIFQNLKEFLLVLRSIFVVFFLSARHGFIGVTISVIHSEKYLYLLWLPFIKVYYILHSEPWKTNNPFVTFTCNNRLGKYKKIITVSKANRNSILSDWGILERSAEYVYVVYNCLLKQTITNRSHLRKSENNRLIITMGHIAEYKNPHLWLAVAQQVTKLRNSILFYWLGDDLGDDKFLSFFQEKTQDIAEIKFLGIVDDPLIYLQNSSIYYQPSLVETQGIAVIEAMANRLPCVVSNVGGLPESIINNVNGILVDPKNIQDNVNAIITLLDNEELCESYGEESYKRYNKFFKYETFKVEMDKLYRY